MPKLKSHSGAAKRFKKNANGGIKRKRANRNHILTKRKTKNKRQLRTQRSMVAKCDTKAIDRLLEGN